MNRLGRSIEDRLRSLMVEEDSGCWRWTGFTNGTLGHGGIEIDGTRRQAHRVAYETWVGPIPEGMTLDHLCRNPPCINPAHLEPVTLAENIRRSFAARWTPTCKRGHLRSEHEVVRKSGYPYCRACDRHLQRERAARRRAA